MSAGLAAVIDLVQNWMNLGMVRENNAERERLAREAMDVVGRSGDLLGDPETYLRGTPAGADSTFDLGEYFTPEKTAEGVFRSEYGGGNDWQRTGAGMGEWLQRARVDPAERARRVGEFFGDTSFSDYLTSELEQIGAGSRARRAGARSSLLSRGMAAGQSLDDLGGELESLDYSEQLGRAGQAATARAGAESMRNQANLARAQAQTEAVGQASAVNAALAQAGAAGELGVGTARETAAYNRGKALAEGAVSDREAYLDRLSQLYFEPRMAANSTAYGYRGDVDKTAASILANYSPSVPQLDFSGVMNFLTSRAAARESRPKTSPFSFGLML